MDTKRELLDRVRWGNVARLAAIVGAGVLIASGPRGCGGGEAELPRLPVEPPPVAAPPAAEPPLAGPVGEPRAKRPRRAEDRRRSKRRSRTGNRGSKGKRRERQRKRPGVRVQRVAPPAGGGRSHRQDPRPRRPGPRPRTPEFL